MSKHLERFHVIHYGWVNIQHDALCDGNYVWCDPHTVMANNMGCVAHWFGWTFVSWWTFPKPPNHYIWKIPDFFLIEPFPYETKYWSRKREPCESSMLF